jgi:hypothetical protein
MSGGKLWLSWFHANMLGLVIKELFVYDPCLE